VFIEAKDDGGGGDNWTAGVISRAKLQSNHHQYQPTVSMSKHWRQVGCTLCLAQYLHKACISLLTDCYPKSSDVLRTGVSYNYEQLQWATILPSVQWIETFSHVNRIVRQRCCNDI